MIEPLILSIFLANLSRFWSSLIWTYDKGSESFIYCFTFLKLPRFFFMSNFDICFIVSYSTIEYGNYPCLCISLFAYSQVLPLSMARKATSLWPTSFCWPMIHTRFNTPKLKRPRALSSTPMSSDSGDLGEGMVVWVSLFLLVNVSIPPVFILE